MASWRMARSIVTLRDELNAQFPKRPKSADGTIGDARHQSAGSGSDHNPWVKDKNGQGVVRAFDGTTGIT